MITINDIKTAKDPTAKAIEFINWKAEIAENKIVWKNPTNDPEKDAETIRTFEKSVNRMVSSLGKNGLPITNELAVAHTRASNYLKALRLSDGEGYTVRENCFKKSGSRFIVDFEVELPEVDEAEEEAIINKINEIKEEAVYYVDSEASGLNDTHNHHKRSEIMSVVCNCTEGGFYARLSMANVNYHYSEKTLDAFTRARTAYGADTNTIYYEVIAVVNGTLDHYEPRFDKYGKRIEKTAEETAEEPAEAPAVEEKETAEPVQKTTEEYRAEAKAIIEDNYKQALNAIDKSFTTEEYEAAILRFQNMEFPDDIPEGCITAYGQRILKYNRALNDLYYDFVMFHYWPAIHEGGEFIMIDDCQDTTSREKYLEVLADFTIFQIKVTDADYEHAMYLYENIFTFNQFIMINEWKRLHPNKPIDMTRLDKYRQIVYAYVLTTKNMA